MQGNLRAEFTEHDMSDQREERGDGSGSDDGVVRTELTSGGDLTLYRSEAFGVSTVETEAVARTEMGPIGGYLAMIT